MVDYFGDDGITAEDEEGLMLALEQRNRVRHLRVSFRVWNLQKLVMAIDGEFSILEYLIVMPPMKDSTALMLRETLQAPNLKHLALGGFTYPIGSQLHPTAVGLVTLHLVIDHPSSYFQPNILLQWISSMPQLERLVIIFTFPVPNRDVERQLTHTPITTPITFPNLRWIWSEGVSAYIETIICRITTPRLEGLHIVFLKQLTFSVPRLVRFMNTTKNFRFDSAVLDFFNKGVCVGTYLRETNAYAFCVTVLCWHLDWQVSSAAQISNALSQVLSVVEHLNLRHKIHTRSSEEHNDVDRIEWHILLRSFKNVKTLRVEDGLVKELSRCLRLEDGRLPLKLLPELQELTYSGSGDTSDAFTSFIEARQNIGHPVTLVHHSPSPSLYPSNPPTMTSASGEAMNDLDT